MVKSKRKKCVYKAVCQHVTSIPCLFRAIIVLLLKQQQHPRFEIYSMEIIIQTIKLLERRVVILETAWFTLSSTPLWWKQKGKLTAAKSSFPAAKGSSKVQ